MDNSDINKSLEDIERAKKDLFSKERMYNKTIKGLSSEEKKSVVNSHNDVSSMFEMLRNGNYSEEKVNEIIKRNEC
jgi:hypothetical protein